MSSFFDTKNASPRQLSSFTAFIIACVNAVLSIFLVQEWYVPLGVFIVTFIIIYWIYNYTLEHFIYRKVKLIYKFIYQTKATKKEEFFYNNILPRKSLDEVNTDVQKWATQKKDEIEVLQANEQFRKEFLMNLTHELRTPIFAIQGYVDTLAGGAIDDPNVNVRFLDKASKSIDRLVTLVDDLNEISRLESGKIPIIQESFIIQDLIRDVYDELSMKAEKKKIDLELKKGTVRQMTVYADKPKIRQVLTNLVENAIKYCNDNSSVTTGCYKMDEKNIYIEVSDNGPGIAEEHLPRIFERFYRADRSRSRTIGGTGLGLAIVKHIVEAHGQTVTVRSKVGVGSSFGFTLEKSSE